MASPSIPPAASSKANLGAQALAIALLLLAHFLVEISDLRSRPEGGLFALGLLLVAGQVGGSFMATFGLPKLTGYLLVGILAGPYAFGVFGESEVVTLTLVNDLALALIALQAGAEFTTGMLRRSARSIGWSTLIQTLLLPVMMALSFAALAGFFDFTAGLSTEQILALGAIWGVVMLSKSPAATLAVIGETRAKGIVVEHTLGVVVVLDVLVLMLFPLALGLAQSSLMPGTTFSASALWHFGEELFASVAAGTTFGLMIALYFRFVGREKLLFLVVVGYGLSAFCQYFHYDTLLVFVFAGVIVTNLTKQGDALLHTTEKLSTAVMIVFFATAGAKLDLRVLAASWQAALALIAARLAGTWICCQIGHWAAKDPVPVRRYGHLAFVSQAGVTIGLVAIAQRSLGPTGVGLATLAIAVIGINQMIGPILYKWALQRAGEIPPPETSSRERELAADPVEEAPRLSRIALTVPEPAPSAR